MPTPKHSVSTLLSIVALLAVASGCGSSSHDGPVTASAPVASTPTADEMKQKFEELARKAEQKLRREQELTEHRRSLIEVTFKGFDDEGRIVVSVANRTGKPIDNIRGGFQAEDLDGNYLASSGFTIESPGVFMEVGQTLDHRPFMNQKPELVEKLQTDPNSVRFAFEARKVTYMDGTSAEGLEGS